MQCFASSLAFIKYALQVVSSFRLTVRVLAAFLTFEKATMLRFTMGIPTAWCSNCSWLNASSFPETIENDEFVS